MNLIKRNNSTGFPSIIDEFFRPDFGGISGFGMNVPAVNIKETDTHFQVELAAPGMKKDDFSIELDNNILTVAAEVKSEQEKKDENGKYTRREFSFSSFKRSFTLPESVNESDIKAAYTDGVLLLSLPKREEALPKPKRLIDIL